MIFQLRRFFVSVISIFGLPLSVSFANDAPVVSVNQDSASTQIESTGSQWQNMPDAQTQAPAQATQNNNQEEFSPAPTGSIDQRVSRLEQQIANLTQMNLPQQIDNLRQTVGQVQGQLQVEDHTLKTLTAQQTSFYQDLEQQISQLKKSNTATATTAPTSTSTATLDDAGTYNAAFKLVTTHHLSQAKSAFQNYLTKFPKGQFASSAHFWLGEIAMQNKSYTEATKQFQTVISNYPTSNKIPDAKLKIATIQSETGKTDAARNAFKQIQKSYPGTTAAQLASIRLQQLPK
ncbi:MAG: tol-pal system protein YbgF [Gammaproteobacteria bacterium RIFCSPHIGHO2_12_FULL_38_14]|nr:MAG: tol-pal system protein YbgF [Gammaproteobacteria bacterium RIFCSPHIGHO2_12_FULL_38_14]